jgi:hypothetical protein
MALVLKDRVKEQTTTTGTGSVTLGGAVSGFEAFSAVGDGNTTYYAIVHQTADEWEVGLGTYTAAGTLLSRDTILESSNSDAAVVFSAGTKDVFVTYPSDKAVYADAAGEVSVTRATSATFATSATEAATAIFATSATNATNAVNVDGGTVSSTDGTFNTLIVVTSASVGGGFNVGGNIQLQGAILMDDGNVIMTRDGTSFRMVTNASLPIEMRTVDAQPVIIKTTNTERMRITSAGLVGIGTTAPASALTVSDGTISSLTPFGGTDLFLDSIGSNYLQFGSGTSSSPAIYFGDSADGDVGGIIYAHAFNAMSFRTNAAERMRIDTSGNVVVGTTTADAAVTVYKNADSLDGVSIRQDSAGSSAGARLKLGNNSDARDAEIVLTGSGNSSYAGARTLNFVSNIGGFGFYRGYTTPVATMVLNSSGNVGIGTSSPSYTLEVAGTSRNRTAVAGSISHFVETTDTGASSFTQLGVSTNAGSLTMQLGTTAGGPTGFIYSAVAGGINMYTSAATNVVLGVNNNTYTYTLDAATGAWSANNAAGPALLNEAASSTNPTLIPNRADTDTGIGWASADTLTAVTGGSERIRLDSGGKLSVGGTTGAGRLNAISSNWPENALAIYSANVASQTNFAGIAFYNQDTDSAVGNVADIYTNPAGTLSLTSGANPAIQLKYGSPGISGGTAALTVDSSGRVGIGTASPARTLTVNGSIQFASGGVIEAGTTTLNTYIAGVVGASGYWAFATNGGERVRIDSAGNVGIGTSSVATNLHVYENTLNGTINNIALLDAGNQSPSVAGSGVAMDFRSGNGSSYFGAVGGYSDGTNYVAGLWGGAAASGAPDLAVTSSGNVGIGTSSPVKKLHVDGPALATIGTLTDGATITPDFDANQNFTVTLGGNRTLANPTNVDAGQTGSIFVVQDATGGRTLSFGANWKFAGGTAPTLSTGANAVDRIDYIVKSSTEIHAVASLNLS